MGASAIVDNSGQTGHVGVGDEDGVGDVGDERGGEGGDLGGMGDDEEDGMGLPRGLLLGREGVCDEDCNHAGVVGGAVCTGHGGGGGEEVCATQTSQPQRETTRCSEAVPSALGYRSQQTAPELGGLRAAFPLAWLLH